MIFPLWKYNRIPLLLTLISLVLYIVFTYDLDREESTKLLMLYFGLFILAHQLIKRCSNFKFLVIISILFRIIFLFAEPNLSQDYYRFIWDGRMLIEGFNPYLHLPKTFFELGHFPINQGLELFNGMGELSTSNYTNYPPINQLCFLVAAALSGDSIIGSIVVMRCIIIGADIGILYFGNKLLQNLKLPTKRMFWYALNPFIIIELTGNLHFEGVMLFFLIWSIYLLQRGKWQWSALLFGCSIAIKLVPLMLLPLLFKFFKGSHSESSIDFKTLISYYAIVGLVVLVLYAPFFSIEFVANYSESVGLWFGNFEFNASIYYVLREIGYWITGYNQIALISKLLSLLTVALIFCIALIRKNNTIPKLITSMLLAVSVYLFLSTTVHPWYLSTLILLCIFTRFRFPLVWSILIVMSYLAYSTPYFRENSWVLSVQYMAVYSTLVYELFFKNKTGEKSPALF